MPLVTTPAGASANAYIDVATADAFALADIGRYAAKWNDAATTVERKEAAIQRATRDIDRYVGEQPYPYAAGVQALRFPRLQDVDLLGAPALPDAVIMACYEQAIYLLYAAELVDDAATRRARGLANFTEPNVSGQLEESPRWSQYSPRMRDLLDQVNAGAISGRIIRT